MLGSLLRNAAKPPFPLYLNSYLLRSGHYCTHAVMQTPRGPLPAAERRPPSPINFRQIESSSSIDTWKLQKVSQEVCKGHHGHATSQEPQYLSSTYFHCNTIPITTPQPFPNMLLKCYFTSIEYARGEFDSCLKLYHAGCMVVTHCRLQIS